MPLRVWKAPGCSGRVQLTRPFSVGRPRSTRPSVSVSLSRLPNTLLGVFLVGNTQPSRMLAFWMPCLQVPSTHPARYGSLSPFNPLSPVLSESPQKWRFALFNKPKSPQKRRQYYPLSPFLSGVSKNGPTVSGLTPTGWST